MQFDSIMDLSFSLIQGVPKKFKIEFLEVKPLVTFWPFRALFDALYTF